MSRSPADLEVARERRQGTSDALLASTAQKRLVVAGPGTGKTYNFRRVLEAAGDGLAVTFIRVLARDLQRSLGDIAQVNTFHGYCKHLAHSLGGVGDLSDRFDYYPALPKLLAEDLDIMGYGGVEEETIERCLHLMDEGDGLLASALEAAAYYDAAGHTDVVYRVQRHLAEHPEAIPEHPVIVVDEYQDFNLLETRLIDTLAEASLVLIAGDDDQALYGFKDASPRYVRELARSGQVERFDLPYCSRCTEVIVESVNQLVDEAQKRGNLADRVAREYLCYLPDKLVDSDEHPALIHAACSVDNNRSPYMRRYICQEISEIPDKDISASHQAGHPTALVIGRLHFVEPVAAFLADRFPNVQLQHSEQLRIEALDGYRRLARDPESRLGWRILLHVDPAADTPTLISTAHSEARELGALLPDEYRERHLEIASLVGELIAEEDLTKEEGSALSAALGLEVDAVRTQLKTEPDEEKESEVDPDADSPSIICTSLVGAKGLSAEHVFIVGFMDGEFPQDPAAVTDDEICQFIVGLSRTRKACHLVSAGNWAGNWRNTSSFLGWLGQIPVEHRDINAEAWKRLKASNPDSICWG